MNVVLCEVRRDGKVWPLGGRRSRADLARAIRAVHRYRCGEGLSFRRIVARLADEGMRVSRGSVHHCYRDFTCERCEDQEL